MTNNLPTRTLPGRPDLDQLKHQAKELLEAFRAGSAEATAEVNQHYRDADVSTFALHDAQLALARAYGFPSWNKLKAHVDGATSVRFDAAVRDGDIPQTRAMLKQRPELSYMGKALHFAVLGRSPQLVELLMENGANARVGVYPHRDATSALTIAAERGYDEIVAIIHTQEQRKRDRAGGLSGAPSPDALFQAIASGATEQAMAMMEAEPALIHSCHPVRHWTPLHVAAHALEPQAVAWLLSRKADAKARGWREQTPLDMAAHQSNEEHAAAFREVAGILMSAGAEMTARAAVALGNADWLRDSHRGGTLANVIDGRGGLLRIAVSHGQTAILALLLEFGFDPDERTRFEDVGGDGIAFTWGMPLYECAARGRHEMAEMLLRRGADPNGKVYASGDPMFQAFERRDWKMVELLQQFGGAPEASTAGLFRQTELARKMLAGEARYKAEDVGGDSMAEQMLWGAACGGDPEIVRMALERVDWPRHDPRWFHILEQPLRVWNHGGTKENPEWDRATYPECLRLLLERCDPNLRGRDEFGLTILHSVAGARGQVTAAERVVFATLLLDFGARTDIRDNLLLSTPLGWACRWG